MKHKKLVAIVLQVYLTLAPINWLPFVSPVVINLIKYLLVLILSYQTFVTKGISVKPYYFFSFNYLLLIIVCALPAIFRTYDNVIYNILDYVFIFLLFWIIRGAALSRQELFDIFYKVAITIGAIGLLSLASALSGITITSPAPWHDPFSVSALGGYRTGWSNSLFLYMPLLLFYFIQSQNRKTKIYCIIAIAGILASQILSGGRSGFICSILSITIFSKFNIKGIIVLLLLTLLVSQSVSYITIEKFFRASDQQLETKAGTSNIDKISSGRIQGYTLGVKFFTDSPLWGNGFGASEYLSELRGYKPDIHNTWLKRFVDGGILLLLPIVILFYKCYKSGVRNIKEQHLSGNYLIMFRTLFFLALFISMGEPNYLVGSFQGEAFFWAMISSFLLGYNVSGEKKLIKRQAPAEVTYE